MTLSKILNTLFSLYANKEDETGCVTCIGDKRTVERILMGKPELKGKLENFKVDGRIRMELNLKEWDVCAWVGFIWLSTGNI